MLLKYIGTLFILIMLVFNNVVAAPSASILKFWQPSNEASAVTVDNNKWQTILDRYLKTNHVSNINRFDYANVTREDYNLLSKYLSQMQALDPATFSRKVQKSYWINLYNALTVKLVLDNYPTPSITKLGDKLFSFGPWDDEIAVIQKQRLSLNDIEHRILRPIWKDNRIHYAVNCASISCPDLSGKAYNATNTDTILNKAARDYVNHIRAVDFKGNTLILSSIYDWYIDDFGGDKKSLLIHLMSFANSELKQKLSSFTGNIKYDYNWMLNEP